MSHQRYLSALGQRRPASEAHHAINVSLSGGSSRPLLTTASGAGIWVVDWLWLWLGGEALLGGEARGRGGMTGEQCCSLSQEGFPRSKTSSVAPAGAGESSLLHLGAQEAGLPRRLIALEPRRTKGFAGVK